MIFYSFKGPYVTRIFAKIGEIFGGIDDIYFKFWYFFTKKRFARVVKSRVVRTRVLIWVYSREKRPWIGVIWDLKPPARRTVGHLGAENRLPGATRGLKPFARGRPGPEIASPSRWKHYFRIFQWVSSIPPNSPENFTNFCNNPGYIWTLKLVSFI